MFISPDCGPVVGTGPGGLAQPNATAPARAHLMRLRSAAVVAKLELDAEILSPQQPHDGLKIVLGRARHPNLLALNTRAPPSKPRP